MRVELFRFARDLNGYSDGAGLPTPDYVYQIQFDQAGDPLSFTIPSEFERYVLQFPRYLRTDGVNFFVNFNATAFLPAVPSMTIGTQMINPFRVEVEKGTVISMVTDSSLEYTDAALYGLRY